MQKRQYITKIPLFLVSILATLKCPLLIGKSCLKAYRANKPLLLASNLGSINCKPFLLLRNISKKMTGENW